MPIPAAFASYIGRVPTRLEGVKTNKKINLFVSNKYSSHG